MEKRTKIYSIVAGIIFILSGIGKALFVSDFSDLIIQYGFAPFRSLAPAIVITEILTGLLLVFQIQRKKVAFAGLIIVIIFSIVYLYGYLQHGIKDGGCFGRISFLALPPVGIFIRNVILLYLLFDIWKRNEFQAKTHTWQKVTILIVMILASFTAGYSSLNGFTGNNYTQYQEKTIEENRLNEFISFSNDSTYLVFVFSYTCEHCLNSIENLKQYEKSGVVDKVIGLTWNDSIGEKNMRENFNPNFSITNYDPMTLFKITNRFPTAYYIKNNRIVLTIQGELPCSYVLLKKIEKLKNSFYYEKKYKSFKFDYFRMCKHLFYVLRETNNMHMLPA